MSLNNEQMLPARRRSMRQMNDLLNVEDMVLNEIEATIDSMYVRMSLLHEELVNEEWLEHRLEELVGGIATVQKCKDELRIQIDINIGKLNGKNEERVIEFINKFLPAHLAYDVSWEQFLGATGYFGVVWQDDEIFTIRQVLI